MSEQSRLRRRIATLERMQEKRIAMVAQRKADMDAVVERAELELTNLRSRLTVGVAR